MFYFLLNGFFLFQWTGIQRTENRNRFELNTNFTILLIIALISQIYPMTLPIETLGDEHYHSYASLPILSVISDKVGIPFPLLGWIALVVTVGLVWLIHVLLGRIKKNRGGIGILMILVVSLIYLFALGRMNIIAGLGMSFKHLIRFPPLGKTVNFIFYALFGVNEFTARLPSLVFYLLTSVYIYRLLFLFREKEAALLGSACFLFLPIFFFYGHMAYLTAGIIFFVVTSIFYFLRYDKENRKEDFILAIFLSSVGFLYERVLLVLFLTFFVYLLLKVVVGKKLPDKISFYLKSFWIGMVPIIPWLFLSYKFGERNYSILVSNWTSWESSFFVFRQMPHAMTYSIFFLFIGGIAYSLWEKRDALTYFSILWFIVFYIFINSDWCRSIRLALPLYFSAIILAVRLLSRISMKKKAIYLSVLFVLSSYLIVGSLFWNFRPLEKEYTLSTNMKTGYVPYPQMMQYIKQHISKGSRIYAPMGCEPSHFYLYLYDMQDEYTWDRKIWIEDKGKQTLNNLYEFSIENNLDYLVFPRHHWSSQWINESLVKTLFEVTDGKFVLIKIFRYGDNEIGLWNIKK